MNLVLRAKIWFLLVMMFSTSLVAQVTSSRTQVQGRPVIGRDYTVSSERYFTGEDGSLLMYVNVWGQVNNPGRQLVYDGIDIATLLSFTGGPKSGANLKKVRLFREVPDENGKLIYYIDFEKFLKTGDRSGFIKVLPNDTYIIPQKTSSYLLSQVGTMNTLLGVINLWFNILYYRERVK